MAVKINVKIDSDPKISVKTDCVIIRTDDESTDYYGGEEFDYIIDPSNIDQILPTAGKRMKSDLTIAAIPYTATINPNGGLTVTILG